VRVFSTYSIGPSNYVRVVDTYTVKFIKFPDITWSVEPLAQVTWESIIPPSVTYQYYPPDYGDYLLLAERSEALSLTSMDWKGKAADGVWTLEFNATSAPIVAATTTYYSSTAYSPTVQPATVRIDNLIITIKFKPNAQYLTANISSTTPSTGVTQAYAQGNLRANGDDRAFIGILCGISGSTTMGILCGYSVLRHGRTGEIYDVSYAIATVCNINHVNSPRNRKAISYWAQNWGDRPFSTKGDAGEAFTLGSTEWRIYPVRGRIGLQVQIQGQQLVFQLMGQYPPLVLNDPTVTLVNTFTRLSLNA